MKKSKAESVLFILPCTGPGVSSNSPYSNELARIGENLSVIDHSFLHILAGTAKPKVVVVVRSGREDIVQYLSKKYKGKVDLVFRKTNREDVAGAVKSVEKLFADKNIVLLPNTIIEMESKDKKVSLANKMLGALGEQPVVFACKEEVSVTRLKLSGAMRIEGGKIVDYKNEPRNPEKFNAFWVAFGFRKGDFKDVFRKTTIENSSPVIVKDFDDLSTWTNLNAYLLKQYLIKSGVDPEFLKTNQ